MIVTSIDDSKSKKYAAKEPNENTNKDNLPPKARITKRGGINGKNKVVPYLNSGTTFPLVSCASFPLAGEGSATAADEEGAAATDVGA